ncbi:HYR domain-containing protein [Winogradskyella epiphytica]|uniref:HYR domain-containing protein n=1 Tax=Winogradskyella epiphytica TaxID=262005 RepID=UPI001E2DFCB1|nr:HYR domain-containing protein [Winogradskyella epiphytica]
MDDTSVPVPDVATLPDVTGECDATVTAPTATDTCSGTITATTTDPLTYNTQGTYTINWTYDDGNGNTSTQPQTVIVDDTSVPVPDVATLPDVTGECDATVTAPTATDNCSGTITATTTDPLTYNAQGTYTIHWTYDDGNGNISTQTQNIIIDDKTPPVVPTLADVIVGECSGTPTAPNTTDNCSGTIIGTTTTVFPITTQGTTIVTWTFDDENGNIITANQNVIVTDTTPPTFNFCPISRSINNDLGNCGAIVTYTIPTANDNCGTVTINQTDATGLTSGDNFPIGTTTIEYTATDGNGNNSICTFTITVIDNEMPTIECPLDDIVVEADSNCEFTSEALALLDPSVITTPSFGDNCTGVNISNNLAGQLPLPVGNHIITWTVSDEAGNTINCNQNITVADVTPPVITCPTPSPFYNTDAGQCHATLSFNATATDNCNGSPIITYEVAGTPITFPYAFTVGTTTVDVIADDGNGLISTCSFNVIVQDNEAPIAVCQTFTVPLDASGNASIVASDIDGGSFDNCSTVTLNASQTTFTCANVGTNNVTLTVTDAAGNIATCNAVVTVLDHVQGATATITSTSGSPICLGESVTFTATGTNLGANPSYQWFEGGTPVGTNSDTYTTTGLTNGENVYVEITSGPCNTVTISNSIVMTVNPLLPVTFTLNASANPACSGENVTFFVTGLTNGGATPTYQWYVNGTPVGGNTNSYNSTTINDNDVVSVDVSSSLACANPIPATESMTMTVNPLPTVTAQANGSSTNITICEGGNLTLTGSGATTYTWDNGVTNGVTFVPTVGTHTYTVTGTSNGCSSTDTIEVTVTPNATITHISGDTNQHVCENNGGDNVTQLIVNTITYSISNATIATVTGLPPGVTYNFNSGTGILTINGNPNDVATTTTYNYTISTNGCGTATASGSITVYNNPDLETPYGVSGWFGSRDIRGEGYVCLPTVETYYVHNNNDVQYYEWQVPAGCTIIGGAGTNEITVQFSNAYNGNGSIRVRAVNPCDTSSWRSKRVRINPIQSLELNAGNDVIACNDETIHLEGSIVDANLLINSVWLNWDDNGAAGNFINITNNGLNIEYVHPPVTEITTVNISLTAYFVSLLCSEGVTDNMTITIYPDPTATITTSSPVCEGEDVVVSGTPNTTVSYNYNGNPAGTFNIGASGTVTFTGLGAGTYSLTSIEYTNAPNCPETINSSVTINEPPTVTAPADVTICEGDTVDLSAATIGGTNYVGTWTTSGNGTFAGNIYTPHAADVFNSPITLTYTNTPSDGICSPVSDSMLVTINQAPTIYAGVDQTICNSDTVTMTASFGGSATSGTWSGGTGTFSSNLPNATYTPGIGETGTVILTYTSNDPAGPCNSAIDTVEITIDQGATVDAGTDQTICEGDTVTLTASFGGSATSATWNTSGSGTFAGNIYTPSVADINNGSVLLTYTTNNPTGVCNPVSDSMLVTINPQPTVNVGNNQTVCSTSTSITMNAVLGGGASSATWSTSGDGSFNNNNTNAVYTFGTNDIANGSVTLTYTTNDPTGPCIAATDSFVVNIIPYIAANPSYTYATNNGDCSDTILNLSADGTGYWSAVSVPAGSPFTFSDTTNPNATFTGESGTEYNLTWNVDNAAPCGDNDATISVTFPTCEDNLNFDGIDDSVNLADNYNLSAPFSIEIWIKPNEIKSGIQTILSKRDASNFATGYDLRLVNNNIIFRANGSGLFTGGITADRWYHIAITYGSNIYTLYVDGVQKNSIAVTFNPSPNNFNMLLGAMARPNNTPTNFFHGWIDELRIWNTVLSRDQIRLMMNQEIENDGGNVIGSVTGNQVSTGLNWSDLTAYYQMNQSSPSPDIIAGQLIATKGVTGTLRNMTTRQPESAPLPYLSSGSNTNWDQQNTWLHGTEQMIPNTNGINWNIVQIEDDVNISRETNVLGLVIQANKLTVNNNQPLYVNKYLKINGVLDLEGESQLLQPVGSIVDYSGTGKLERDQQGTSNMFNYNYWGSPVSTSGSALDRNYTVGAILYDGSNPVNWVTSHNTAITSNPVTISSRWLYTYANLTGLYSEWQSINQGTPIDVGLGYTMKGSGAATPNQNYTFVGQPNNGDIKVSITANNESLMGNPYPSAIDAHTFIDDNETVLLAGSALIFWEQAPNNPNHILADYLGRYSYLSKAGGLQAASSPTEINGVGNATKIPGRYIPVGQGFFVKAENDGDVVFNNGQREFMKEGAQSVFLRPEGDVTTQSETNTNDVDLIKRIRFGFKTPEGAFRHLLLAFTPDNDATDAVDYGYDALNSDDFPSDMSFLIEDDNYVIQGVGEFDITKVYPLEMVLGQQGNVEVELGELENFDEEIDVFIYDAVLNTYTRFNDVNFQMNLEAGTYSNRFYLTFQEDAELSIIEDEFETVIVRYLHDTDEIYVKTPPSIQVKQLYLINVAGQMVYSWNATNLPMSHEIKIPVKHISEGAYILKAETDTGTFNRKLIIKYKR